MGRKDESYVGPLQPPAGLNLKSRPEIRLTSRSALVADVRCRYLQPPVTSSARADQQVHASASLIQETEPLQSPLIVSRTPSHSPWKSLYAPRKAAISESLHC